MNDNDFEIAWRKELVKRLAYPLNQLQAARDKEAVKRLEHTQKLAKFSTFEDAQEAYGYGDITLDELDTIQDLFNGVEKKESETVTGAALGELIAFITRLNRDIRDFKWEALPDEEKERINRENAVWRENHKRRCANGS